ncbi:MAG: UDP-N-acetylmuramoyl-tripeptide--D-alanyl-D-alanine ligase [Candidatus Taylorbacteria bacterium]|nr:UDP-N-acetylmuramoyl-tripeptide--D-alanyl-D-alanine ligase [Candidatus Taylorbacteria bacterium]
MKSFLKKIIYTILTLESKIILNKYKPAIVTVTGTVGKTSTKDAIYTVLSRSDYVRKSEKSFNSEIGVPLTILGCHSGWNDPFIWASNILEGLELIFFKSNYPKCLVLEVGADHPGDIESISRWLKSDVVVINKIGDIPVHVEFFPSPADVVKEKAMLIKSLKKDGTLVLFADDKKVSALSQGVIQTVVTFGINEVATVTASNISVIYDDNKKPEGMSFRLNHKGNSIPMKIKGILGIQQIYPIVAGATVGIIRNIPISDIVDSFEHHQAPNGRMSILDGINGSIIIDDSYNSSPDALCEGLTALASLQVSGKRIAVLGDMMELGNFSADEHRKAGVQALQSCDVLITVGPRARFMSDRAISWNTSEEAGEYVKSIVGEGDVVFVKGSQSMRMERVSKALLAEPEKAGELLVRQDSQWLAKE